MELVILIVLVILVVAANLLNRFSGAYRDKVAQMDYEKRVQYEERSKQSEESRNKIISDNKASKELKKEKYLKEQLEIKKMKEDIENFIEIVDLRTHPAYQSLSLGILKNTENTIEFVYSSYRHTDINKKFTMRKPNFFLWDKIKPGMVVECEKDDTRIKLWINKIETNYYIDDTNNEEEILYRFPLLKSETPYVKQENVYLLNNELNNNSF